MSTILNGLFWQITFFYERMFRPLFVFCSFTAGKSDELRIPLKMSRSAAGSGKSALDVARILVSLFDFGCI